MDPGNLVFVQLQPQVIVEGYWAQGDSNFWHNPDFLDAQWAMRARPAIVLSTKMAGGRCRAQIVLLSDLSNSAEEDRSASVKITGSDSGHSNCEATFTISIPEWTRPNTYCYAIPRIYTVTIMPDQVCHSTSPISANLMILSQLEHLKPHWSIPVEAVGRLVEYFKSKNPSFNDLESSSDPDLNQEAQLSLFRQMRNDFEMYAKFTAISPENISATQLADKAVVDWSKGRGFIDELLKVTKRRCAEWGWSWSHEDEGEGDLTNSYGGEDFSMWDDVNGERDKSLTLPREFFGDVELDIEQITEVID